MCLNCPFPQLLTSEAALHFSLVGSQCTGTQHCLFSKFWCQHTQLSISTEQHWERVYWGDSWSRSGAMELLLVSWNRNYNSKVKDVCRNMDTERGRGNKTVSTAPLRAFPSLNSHMLTRISVSNLGYPQSRGVIRFYQVLP